MVISRMQTKLYEIKTFIAKTKYRNTHIFLSNLKVNMDLELMSNWLIMSLNNETYIFLMIEKFNSE